MNHDYNHYELWVGTFDPPPTFRSNVKARRGGGRYNDEWYAKYRQFFIDAAVRAGWDKMLVDGGVIFDYKVYWRQPKKLVGVRKEFADHDSRAVPMSVRPDLDNLMRPAMDALQGIAYKDDGQITRIIASKEYLGPGECVYYTEVRVGGYGEWRDNEYAERIRADGTSGGNEWASSFGGDEITTRAGKRVVLPSDTHPE